MHGHSFSQLKPTHDLFAKYFVEATISSAKHVLLDMHIIIIIPLAIIIGIKEAAGTYACIASQPSISRSPQQSNRRFLRNSV